MFVFSQIEHKTAVMRLVMTTIMDERLEVRETSSESLSGFFHCAFVDVTDDLVVSEWVIYHPLNVCFSE
jgi:hypothetical protein